MAKLKKCTLFLTICAAVALSLPTLMLTGCKQNGGKNQTVSYRTEELYSANGESNIYGKLYLPAEGQAAEKMPAVVLSHSANLTADSMNAYCIGFAERGYAAYAFDFCGACSDSRSDGSTKDMTIFTEKDDLKAVIQTVKGLDFVDPDSVYLFGTSQGGLVSALVANDISDEIAGLMLLYPAFNIPELASSFSGDSGGFGSFGSFGSSSYGEAFVETIKDYDVYANIGNFKGDVLILHGSNDFIVSSDYSQRAAEIYENCQLYIIEGATHGFNSENLSFWGFDMSFFFGDYDEEVWDYIDAYLAGATQINSSDVI